ncbi:hypothetical protein [Streptomyces tricolor]|uniref:hypothetical protein n=1 Tax=Streptomyces tricolor TaxID=68277 RepID=UPI0036DFC4F8
MHRRGHMLRLTAVSVLVVLALTGFKGRGHGHSGGDGGGGGCSSSGQDHDSSSSTSSGGGYGSGTHHGYDDDYGDDDHGSGATSTSGGTNGRYQPGRPAHRATSTPSGGSGERLKDGTAKLISCATEKKAYATVEITNPNEREAEFQARVTFYDDEGTLLLGNSSYTVTVPAKGRATTRVPVGDRLLLKVDRCEADPEAEVRP